MTQTPAPSRAQQLLQKLRAASQAGQPALQTFNDDTPQVSQVSGSAHISDAEKLQIFEESLAAVEQHNQQQVNESPTQDYVEPIAEDDPQQSVAASPLAADAVQFDQTVETQQAQEFSHQTSDALAAQAMPQYAEELYQEVQPQQVGGSRGERIHVGAGMDSAAIEAATGMQAVEYEPQPEISPEVQEYMQSVEEHQETLPQEIVIADGHQAPTNTHVPKQPVIVLPVDESIEQKARFKGPKYAIAWLWRWTRKVSKMFPNKVVYKFVEEPQQ